MEMYNITVVLCAKETVFCAYIKFHDNVCCLLCHKCSFVCIRMLGGELAHLAQYADTPPPSAHEWLLHATHEVFKGLLQRQLLGREAVQVRGGK